MQIIAKALVDPVYAGDSYLKQIVVDSKVVGINVWDTISAEAEENFHATSKRCRTEVW